MTDENFTYEEFEKLREDLAVLVTKSLTEKEKVFLVSFVNGYPDWKDFDYSQYPAIKWKQLNINKLNKNNLIKFEESVKKLENLLC